MTSITSHYVRTEIIRLMEHAPPEVRLSIIALFRAAKFSLNAGFVPDIRGIPLRGWSCLLNLLSGVASMQQDTDALLRVTNDLLTIADKMASPGDVLRQSGSILVHALHADLYVCRLRDAKGEWHIHSAERADGGTTPMFSPFIEESMQMHPVMHRILKGGSRYVLSNNLRGIERGGESLDCMAYLGGYRSRLAFILREHMNDKPPFGLVMLYTQREYGFESYDARFLGKCAGIISLTVGRRVSIARDVLEKAAGGMAHHGNNALNILRNKGEFCSEMLEDMDDYASRALRIARALCAEFPPNTREYKLAEEVEYAIKHLPITALAGQLGGILECTRRMERIINALKLSAARPKLMHYALGHDVLDLGDTSKDD